MALSQVARARRGLAIYGAITVVATAVLDGAMIRNGKPIGEQILLVIALMWTPTVASIIARLILREGVADVSFRWGGWEGTRMMLLAWLFPVVVGGLAYGTAWATGLEQFAPQGNGSPGALQVIRSVLFNLTIGCFFSAITAAGEEFGWRGYMLTRLVDAGVRRPLLISGLIWAAWHAPLILAGIYAAGPRPALSAILFTFGVTSAAYVAARVRLQSGSVWPAVMFHSSWNAVIQGTFDVFTKGGNASRTTTVWTGESGILTVLVLVASALYLMRRPWPALRRPGEEPMATFGLRNG